MAKDEWDKSFQERHGITIEEWNEQLEEKFKVEMGMTIGEWYINRFKTLSPVELLKEHIGVISENDVTIVKDLQNIGLSNGVINVLLEYVVTSNGLGLIHSLILGIGRDWLNENIVSIEQAIEFIKEIEKRYKDEHQ